MNNVLSLDDLFHKRAFHIPDYQRGYSWEARQVREFLEDLELLGSEGFHYTGTVVLHTPPSERQWMDEDGNRYAPVAIVDGQQRLTTIVILLDAIRRLLAGSSEEDQALAQGVRRNFVSVRATNGEALYKLTLNQDTDHFFRHSILADTPGVEGMRTSAQHRLASAKDQIWDYLLSYPEDGGEGNTKWLRRLYEKIATQLRFTVYEVEHEAEVGVIFEVMNDRGKPLTELEKVKNFLLHASVSLGTSQHPNRLAKSVNEAWAAILAHLMSAGLESSADENRLLRAHWLTRYDPQPRQWHGSRSVKDRFALRQHKDEKDVLLEELNRYTEGLRQECVAFCDSYAPRRANAFDSFRSAPRKRDEVVEWSAKLVSIGVVAPFLPLLLATRRRWPKRSDRYLELLRLCEAFAFRVYRLAGWRADAAQASLFRLAHEVAKEHISYAAMLTRIKEELARRCSDSDFEKYLEGRGDWYRWGGLRYFLYEYEIELALQNGASPKVAWDELRTRDLKDTIEHILPQSIDGRPYWQSRFKPDKHEKYVHDLGNLTLTKHNSHYSNKAFPKKRGNIDAKGRCYAKSPLFMEQALVRWKDWRSKTIDERRMMLLAWARERWAVDLDDVVEDADFVGSEGDALEEEEDMEVIGG